MPLPTPLGTGRPGPGLSVAPTSEAEGQPVTTGPRAAQGKCGPLMRSLALHHMVRHPEVVQAPLMRTKVGKRRLSEAADPSEGLESPLCSSQGSGDLESGAPRGCVCPAPSPSPAPRLAQQDSFYCSRVCNSYPPPFLTRSWGCLGENWPGGHGEAWLADLWSPRDAQLRSVLSPMANPHTGQLGGPLGQQYLAL